MTAISNANSRSPATGRNQPGRASERDAASERTHCLSVLPALVAFALVTQTGAF